MLSALLRKLLPAFLLLLVLPACALDGFVITAHRELPAGQFGNIHDGSTPGVLTRYDIRDDKTVGTKVLYAKDGVGDIALSPFGDRVAFTKPNGMIAVISVDGGDETDLISFIGGEQRKEAVATGIQWPAGDGGKWIYYYDVRPGSESVLRRVNVDTKQDEFVVRFNRYGWGALSPDTTPHSGHCVMRTDNYDVVIYDFRKGDGDLFGVPTWNPGCGISVSPDSRLFAANGGAHNTVALVDMNAQYQGGFRVNQWDGDPTAGATTREQIGWAWQGFRWGTNAMNWIVVHQGPLHAGTTHETYYQDAVLYDWVNKRQINVTHNPAGKFERVGGFWELGANAGFLGYFAGKAPFTVALQDARLTAGCAWQFGDGAGATGATVRHTYTQAGTYTIQGTQGGQTFTARVTVAPPRAPQASVIYLNANVLLVDFDEPVAGTAAVKLKSHTKVAGTVLNATGRRLIVKLADPLHGADALTLGGLHDTAQVPNEVAHTPLPIIPPAWPSDRRDLVFLWDTQQALNAVYNASTESVRVCKISPSEGQVGYDRFGRLRIECGRMGTGFWGNAGAQGDFHDLVIGGQFALETTFQAANLTQSRPDFPVRLVNISAWHAGDWECMLGQQKDRLLFSIRTSDNFLNLDGKPVKVELHGRAPIYEIAVIPDTKPHHLIVSYTSGNLVAFMDGKQVFQTKEVTGSLLPWGYGELNFGECHNHHGPNYGWAGRMEGIAIYKRTIDATEAAAEYAIAQRKMQQRKTLPEVTVEATLTARSAIPDPKTIAPYTEALVVNAYTITRVVEATKGWTTKLTPGQKIQIAQWGIAEGRRTSLAQARVGDTRTLVLELYAKHPDKLDQMVTSNDLDDAGALLLFEPR